MGNVRYISLAEAARAEDAWQIGQIGDRLDVRRALLASEGAIEIGTDPDVPRVARDLADVIDMIRDRL